MYTSILVLLLYHLHMGGGVGAMECNTYHKQTSGTINALSTTNVSRVSRCQYEIKTDRFNSWMKLSWRRFSMDGGKMPDCDGGRVEVFTGCTSSRKVAVFCSKNLRSLPHDIYSPDNCIKLVFYNTNGKSRGFIASWKSYSRSEYARFPGISCSFWTQKLTARSGVVGSPRWPSNYNQKTCSWTFRTGDTGLRYVYNIMDMNMYKDSNRGCDSMYSDNVYVKGEKSLTTKRKPKWYYCRHQSVDNNVFDTQYYEIDVQMRIRRDRNGYRGFVIGFIAYEDEVARALSSWGSLVGGLIVAFIAVIFVFCCYRRWRRRQLTESRPLVVASQPPAGVPPPSHHLPPAGSYPTQPAPAGGAYPAPGAYPQQIMAPGAYPPPQGYPPPPVYSDKPPEYQPPPYEPPQGGYQPPPPATGGYPAQYPPPQGYPASYPPPQ